MSTRRPIRVYTVEEARALPPPTEDEIRLRGETLDRLHERAIEYERRTGREITVEDVLSALDAVRNDEDAAEPGAAK